MMRFFLVPAVALLAMGAAALPVLTPGYADAEPLPGSGTRLQVADAATSVGRDATTGTDPAQSRNAARSRMRECGHQWSSMKKSGAANGMTWKDFSQGCLAKQ